MSARKSIIVIAATAALAASTMLAPSAYAAATIEDNSTNVSDAQVLSVWNKYGKKSEKISANPLYSNNGLIGINGKSTSIFASAKSKPTAYSVRTSKSKTSKTGISWSFSTKYLPAGTKKFGVVSGKGTSLWGNVGSKNSSTVKLKNGLTVATTLWSKGNNKVNGSDVTSSFSVKRGKTTTAKGSYKVQESVADNGKVTVTGTVKITKGKKTTTTRVKYSYTWNKSYTKKIVAKGGKGSAVHLKFQKIVESATNALMAGKVTTRI